MFLNAKAFASKFSVFALFKEFANSHQYRMIT